MENVRGDMKYSQVENNYSTEHRLLPSVDEIITHQHHSLSTQNLHRNINSQHAPVFLSEQRTHPGRNVINAGTYANQCSLQDPIFPGYPLPHNMSDMFEIAHIENPDSLQTITSSGNQSVLPLEHSDFHTFPTSVHFDQMRYHSLYPLARPSRHEINLDTHVNHFISFDPCFYSDMNTAAGSLPNNPFMNCEAYTKRVWQGNHSEHVFSAYSPWQTTSNLYGWDLGGAGTDNDNSLSKRNTAFTNDPIYYGSQRMPLDETCKYTFCMSEQTDGRHDNDEETTLEEEELCPVKEDCIQNALEFQSVIHVDNTAERQQKNINTATSIHHELLIDRKKFTGSHEDILPYKNIFHNKNILSSEQCSSSCSDTSPVTSDLESKHCSHTNRTSTVTSDLESKHCSHTNRTSTVTSDLESKHCSHTNRTSTVTSDVESKHCSHTNRTSTVTSDLESKHSSYRKRASTVTSTSQVKRRSYRSRKFSQEFFKKWSGFEDVPFVISGKSGRQVVCSTPKRQKVGAVCEKKFKCETCDRCFYSHQKFSHHVKKHAKFEDCCTASFNQDLITHSYQHDISDISHSSPAHPSADSQIFRTRNSRSFKTKNSKMFKVNNSATYKITDNGIISDKQLQPFVKVNCGVFSCSTCRVCFSSCSEYRTHKCQQHCDCHVMSSDSDSSTTSHYFDCSVCGVKFENKFMYSKHCVSETHRHRLRQATHSCKQPPSHHPAGSEAKYENTSQLDIDRVGQKIEEAVSIDLTASQFKLENVSSDEIKCEYHFSTVKKENSVVCVCSPSPVVQEQSEMPATSEDDLTDLKPVTKCCAQTQSTVISSVQSKHQPDENNNFTTQCLGSTNVTAICLESTDITARRLESTNVTAGCLESTNVTAGCLESTDIKYRHLESINVTAGCLESTNIKYRHLESTNVTSEHLESTDIKYRHLESTNVTAECLQSTDIKARYLESTNVTAECLESTDIKARHLESTNVTAEHLESTDIKYRHLESRDVTTKYLQHLGTASFSSSADKKSFVCSDEQPANICFAETKCFYSEKTTEEKREGHVMSCYHGDQWKRDEITTVSCNSVSELLSQDHMKVDDNKLQSEENVLEFNVIIQSDLQRFQLGESRCNIEIFESDTCEQSVKSSTESSEQSVKSSTESSEQSVKSSTESSEQSVESCTESSEQSVKLCTESSEQSVKLHCFSVVDKQDTCVKTDELSNETVCELEEHVNEESALRGDSGLWTDIFSGEDEGTGLTECDEEVWNVVSYRCVDSECGSEDGITFELQYTVQSGDSENMWSIMSDCVGLSADSQETSEINTDSQSVWSDKLSASCEMLSLSHHKHNTGKTYFCKICKETFVNPFKFSAHYNKKSHITLASHFYPDASIGKSANKKPTNVVQHLKARDKTRKHAGTRCCKKIVKRRCNSIHSSCEKKTKLSGRVQSLFMSGVLFRTIGLKKTASSQLLKKLKSQSTKCLSCFSVKTNYKEYKTCLMKSSKSRSYKYSCHRYNSAINACCSKQFVTGKEFSMSPTKIKNKSDFVDDSYKMCNSMSEDDNLRSSSKSEEKNNLKTSKKVDLGTKQLLKKRKPVLKCPALLKLLTTTSDQYKQRNNHVKKSKQRCSHKQENKVFNKSKQRNSRKQKNKAENRSKPKDKQKHKKLKTANKTKGQKFYVNEKNHRNCVGNKTTDIYCNVCDKSYSSKSHLYRHFRTEIHKQQLLEKN